MRENLYSIHPIFSKAEILVIIQIFSKSQKSLSKTNKVFRAFLSTQKSATKLVTRSQSQISELVFCQLAFLAEASKNNESSWCIAI